MSSPRREVAAGTSAWLDAEVADWVRDGIVTPEAGEAIRSRYAVRPGSPPAPQPGGTRRNALVRLVLVLGACFVSAGLIWLVASNLDALSPLARFLTLLLIWLGLVAAGAVLAARRADCGDVASPVVGVVQLLAGAAYGTVVFQAAQSLQVPAYAPGLIAVWGLGTILYAYAVAGRSVAVLAIGLLAGWYVWEVVAHAHGRFGFAAGMLVAAVLAAAIGVLHGRLPERAGLGGFGALWSHLGAGLALIGLFAAALPAARAGSSWPGWLVAGALLALLLAGAAALTGDRADRLEVALMVVTAAAGAGLALWTVDTMALSEGRLDAAGLLRVAASVVVYLAVASGVALLGTWRSRPVLTLLATIALIIFVTFQAFAVFAPILPGAVLFLVVGSVLLGTGFLADRGRRRLEASVAEARP